MADPVIFPLKRDYGTDIYSVQMGEIVHIDGDTITARLEGVVGPVEFDRDDFSDFDLPKLKVGAKIRYETGRLRTPERWGSYSLLNIVE